MRMRHTPTRDHAPESTFAINANGVSNLFRARPDRNAVRLRPGGLGQPYDVLGDLESLHGELVVGAVTPGRLRALSSALGRMDKPSDPGHAELLAEIQLRVAVEIAKYRYG